MRVDFLKHFCVLVIAVMNAASSDWAASRLGVAIERVAAALVEPVEEPPIMPTRELLRSAAVSDVMNSRRSLDHLVGAGEQSRWNFEAERFSRLDIDDRHKLGCLFNWDVARFSPPKNFVHKSGGAGKLSRKFTP